ncbi:hypothetical protein SE18_26455 [Herpetosiphon geysericola]|uniref:Hemerythrin n=2 Tax=Herpetosiphon geysericola TaxID=70996 RepID=A0A0P6X9H3_9CHLR|nr:hypothetical protein SE18_26455 [Herpetosiphon geysericola]
MQATSLTPDVIAETTLTSLADTHPNVMAVLREHGFDLCCGGGLSLSQAAQAHNVELAPIVAALSAILAKEA